MLLHEKLELLQLVNGKRQQIWIPLMLRPVRNHKGRPETVYQHSTECSWQRVRTRIQGDDPFEEFLVKTDYGGIQFGNQLYEVRILSIHTEEGLRSSVTVYG